MNAWMPLRKVVAAVIAALVAAPAVMAFVPTEWAPVISAAVPVIVAYLVPERKSVDPETFDLSDAVDRTPTEPSDVPVGKLP